MSAEEDQFYLEYAVERIARVERLHRRRKHTANGGTSLTFDFIHFGQTEFPDQCDHCCVPYPCATATALGGPPGLRSPA